MRRVLPAFSSPVTPCCIFKARRRSRSSMRGGKATPIMKGHAQDSSRFLLSRNPTSPFQSAGGGDALPWEAEKQLLIMKGHAQDSSRFLLPRNPTSPFQSGALSVPKSKFPARVRLWKPARPFFPDRPWDSKAADAFFASAAVCKITSTTEVFFSRLP